MTAVLGLECSSCHHCESHELGRLDLVTAEGWTAGYVVENGVVVAGPWRGWAGVRCAVGHDSYHGWISYRSSFTEPATFPHACARAPTCTHEHIIPLLFSLVCRDCGAPAGEGVDRSRGGG